MSTVGCLKLSVGENSHLVRHADIGVVSSVDGCGRCDRRWRVLSSRGYLAVVHSCSGIEAGTALSDTRHQLQGAIIAGGARLANFVMLSGDFVLRALNISQRIVITRSVVANATIRALMALVRALWGPLTLRTDTWLSSGLRTVMT